MNGSCLCGTVRYEVDRLAGPITLCHCLTCQKAHASAFAATVNVLREHFRWLSGHERVSAYESSPGKLRRFCSACGSHLVAERVHEPHVIVRIATLDDDPGAAPERRIWRSHDRAWLTHADRLESHREWAPPKI